MQYDLDFAKTIPHCVHMCVCVCVYIISMHVFKTFKILKLLMLSQGGGW